MSAAEAVPGATLFERVARLYEEDLRVPANNVCRLRCDARSKLPLLPWHVGDRYDSDPRRLVLVCRPHREEIKAGPRPSGILDGRDLADRLYRTKTWPFWRYTRALLDRVYGSESEGWDRVVLTTIVKCTKGGAGGEAVDETTATMKLCCIREVGVIGSELEILKPANVVLLTGRGYDLWLKHLCSAPGREWRDVTSRLHLVDCGGVPMPWWEARIVGRGKAARVLRLDHPHGKPLADYVGMVAAWLTRGGNAA